MKVLAAQFNPGNIENPTGYESTATALGDFLTNIASAVAIGGGILLFLYLVYGGFRYLTAGGDEKAVDTAKRIMTNAVIGLVIIVTAFFITEILGTVLGFGNIFELEFPHAPTWGPPPNWP